MLVAPRRFPWNSATESLHALCLIKQAKPIVIYSNGWVYTNFVFAAPPPWWLCKNWPLGDLLQWDCSHQWSVTSVYLHPQRLRLDLQLNQKSSLLLPQLMLTTAVDHTSYRLFVRQGSKGAHQNIMIQPRALPPFKLRYLHLESRFFSKDSFWHFPSCYTFIWWFKKWEKGFQTDSFLLGINAPAWLEWKKKRSG